MWWVDTLMDNYQTVYMKWVCLLHVNFTLVKLELETATERCVLERKDWKMGNGTFLSLYWFIHKSNPFLYYWSTVWEQTTDKTSWNATHCKTFPLCPQEAQTFAFQVWTGFQSLLQSQIQTYVIPPRTAFLGSQHQPRCVWGSLASRPKDFRMIWTWIEKGRVKGFHILEAWPFSYPLFLPWGTLTTVKLPWLVSFHLFLY